MVDKSSNFTFTEHTLSSIVANFLGFYKILKRKSQNLEFSSTLMTTILNEKFHQAIGGETFNKELVEGFWL